MPCGQRGVDLDDAIEVVVATGVDRRGAIEARFREHGDRVLLSKTHDCVFQGLARVTKVCAQAEISYRHGMNPTTVVRRNPVAPCLESALSVSIVALAT